MSAVKLIGLAILFCFAALVTKQTRPDIALGISLAGGVFILLSVMELAAGLVGSVTAITSGLGIDGEYIAVALKAVGIGYLVHFASGICADAGESALSSKVELGGKLMILALALPIISDILAMMRRLLSI